MFGGVARHDLLIDPKSLVTGEHDFAGQPFSIDGAPAAFSDGRDLLVGVTNDQTGVLDENGVATVQVEETVDGAWLTLRLPSLGLAWEFQMPAKDADLGALVTVYSGPGEPSSRHETIGPPGPTVQSDWTETDPTHPGYIEHKPTLGPQLPAAAVGNRGRWVARSQAAETFHYPLPPLQHQHAWNSARTYVYGNTVRHDDALWAWQPSDVLAVSHNSPPPAAGWLLLAAKPPDVAALATKTALTAETDARTAADTALSRRIDSLPEPPDISGLATRAALAAEAGARADADTAVRNALSPLLTTRVPNLETGETAAEHRLAALEAAVYDLIGATPATGWADANSDTQGGIILSATELTLDAMKAATSYSRSPTIVDDTYYGVRIPHGSNAAQARAVFTAGDSLVYRQQTNTISFLGSDDDWDYYAHNGTQIGDNVASIVLQVTGSAAHVGTSTYLGNLAKAKVYAALKQILVQGGSGNKRVLPVFDDSAETVAFREP